MPLVEKFVEKCLINIILNKTALTATTTVNTIYLSLSANAPTATSTLDLDIGYFTCADYSSNQISFPGITAVASNLYPTTQINTSTSTVNFYEWISNSGITLPAGKCIAMSVTNTGIAGTITLNGTTQTGNGYFNGNYGQSYAFNTGGAPFESYLKDAYYNLCSGTDCSSNASEIVTEIPSRASPNCQLTTSENLITFIAIVLFAPDKNAENIW